MCFIGGAALIGGFISAAASIAGGAAQSAAYQAQQQAHIYESQADSAAGAYESRNKQAEVNKIVGKQITAFAASGLDLSGTPMDVVQDTVRQGYLDKQMIRANWQNRSNMAFYQSQIDEMNSKNAMTGGIIGAIAPVFNSFRPGQVGIAGAYYGSNPGI